MTASERRPISRQRSPWREIGDGAVLDWPTGTWRRDVADGVLLAIVGDEPRIGWHLSISFRDHRRRPSRYPTWDEIADARDELLPGDVGFVMHLPPAGEYVALHDSTFHLHEHPPRGVT
jgi:hypothetical protein